MPGKFNLEGYNTVAERILSFYTKYPEGAIRTTMLSEPGAKVVVVKAESFSDKLHTLPIGTGHAHEIEGQGMVNTTSALENCETSAVGRALAMAGFEVTKGIASREEMAGAERRAQYTQPAQTAAPQTAPQTHAQPQASGYSQSPEGLTAPTRRLLYKMMEQKGIIGPYADKSTPEGKKRLDIARSFIQTHLGKSSITTEAEGLQIVDILAAFDDMTPETMFGGTEVEA